MLFLSLAATLIYFLALGRANLEWEFTNNEEALCNDFTQAGFFQRNASDAYDEKKWVIFLESGTLCYSSETCNQRYFQPYIRERYSTDGKGSFGEFDTTIAWENTGLAGVPLAQFVNPLVTSVYCFRNETRYFGSSEEFSIEGRDILSSDCTENPTFCNHGHVLIPYCSSDVWLGNENNGTRDYPSTKMNPPCDCWDRECFDYNSTSEELQFTFRGRTIFQSVLQRLDEIYNLQEAEEIVLVGSSVGGVGVLNLVNWVKENYRNVDLKVVVDSSWFVNFRDRVNQEFNGLRSSIESRASNDTNNTISSVTQIISNRNASLMQVVNTHEACIDTRLGYPCCFAAECLLTQSSRITRQPYYPRDVPLFALTSLYDLFLLSEPLANLMSDQYTTVGFAVQFVSMVGEFGGVMNTSILSTATAGVLSNLNFSYYAATCMQHIYLASSSLIDGRGTLLGSEDVVMDPKVVQFR